MKILYSMIYAPEKGGSGAPIYTYHLLKGMTKKRVKCGIVFSVHTSYKNPENVFYESIPLYFDKPPIFDNQPQVADSIAFRDMNCEQITNCVNRFYIAFEKEIVNKKYDLIHIMHGMYIGYTVSLIKNQYHIPYIISCHNMETNFLPEFPDPVFAAKAMVDADKILVLSKTQKQKILDVYSRNNIVKLEAKNKDISIKLAESNYLHLIGNRQINPADILVCPLGINLKLFNIRKFQQLPKELTGLHLPKNARIILYAGRLIEMKGIRHLLAAEKIYNKNGDAHTIVLGGGELQNIVIKACNNNKNIHYFGFKTQEEMPAFYNFAAEHRGVLCVPSSTEGMSLVNLESLACGLRVVACCKKDMGHLDFMKKPNAIFSKFGNNNDIAQKILLILKTKPRRRSAIRKTVINYSPQIMIDQIHAIYKSVLKLP